MSSRIKSLYRHQRLLAESPIEEIILSGGWGSGKSYALCIKVVFLLMRYPLNRGFLCRKTLQSLKTSTLKTLLTGDGDVPPALPPYLIKSHNKQDRLITVVNDSELYYGNMDMNFLKSTNLGFGAVDEATELTEEEWNALNGRLRLASIPVRQVFGATNPGSPNHWIYNRFVTNPIRDGQIDKTFFIKSSSFDNISLPKGYLENLQRTLFGHYYQRYVMGEWVGADKVVYDNFDPKIHVIKPFEIPKHWKRYRTVDFGYRAPFFCGWFAVASEDVELNTTYITKGDVILYRELYYTQRTTQVNAKRINEFSVYPDGTPEKIEFTVADWDAGDRADLEAEGIKTIKANKDITIGIQKVRERLGNNDPTRGLITPARFFILENSLAEHDPKIRLDIETGKTNNNPTQAREEFMVYGWKTPRSGEIKEEPEDENNHAMDGIRYMMVALDMERQWVDIPFRKL